NGLAWGRGLHGDGAPARPGPVKAEGDGKSPAGIFDLGGAWGYAAAAPAGARLPYTAATASWQCVDDPASSHYNRLLDASAVAVDWSSHEDLRRDDDVYRWLVEVKHNAAATPGAGSCIFLHVWRGPGTSTAGCTAMDEPRLESLLVWLDPAAHPRFVLLPAADYAAVWQPWALPPP
ncbi:MAG TPA: hypothetical protein VHE35_02095, partial [Kofleriaceae bacterium]|nr:hypothetical protein [Kofleriaceae bacterium]